MTSTLPSVTYARVTTTGRTRHAHTSAVDRAHASVVMDRPSRFPKNCAPRIAALPVGAQLRASGKDSAHRGSHARAMTKFEGLAKGDRKSTRALSSVLDDVYDVPADGFVVTASGALTTTDDGDDALNKEDARRVERAMSRTATTSAAPKAFFDVCHEDWASATAIVVEFARHERDATSNAARALDWFAARCDGVDDGVSYASAAVRLTQGGKILTIDGPVAFQTLKKTRTTSIGAAESRDVWCDIERGTVFANLASVAGTAIDIPQSALYLGQITEISFASMLKLISRSMDCFQGDAKIVPRVGLCGALVDERGLTAECACVEVNRIRVSRARQELELKRETAESTKRRLRNESEKLGHGVRNAVAYAASAKRLCKKQSKRSIAAWDPLCGDNEDDDDED